MLNYEIDPALLGPLIPDGTELDDWKGRTLASLVAFRFLRTRLLGVPVPGHRDFEELNLRFYVRRRVEGQIRRAVVFVREVVPSCAVVALARLVYHEPYRRLPMRSRISPGPPPRAAYAWRVDGRWHTCAAAASGPGAVPAPDTLDSFVTEHYWGYTRRRDGGTMEYRVEHPRWTVWPVSHPTLDADLAALYGPDLAAALRVPRSACLADGSAVMVYRPARLSAAPPHPSAHP